MGGGTMRAAAKVAGLTAASAVHHHGAAISRRVSSLRAVASETEDVKLVVSGTEADVDRRAGVEADDWVYVDDGIKPMGRVVFGGAPSFREAKEATAELSEALEKTYLSSPCSVGSSPADQKSRSSMSNSSVQIKDCVTASEVTVASPVTAPAVMAFKFLSESPVAQNVVASIASDTDVWNAVLQNSELQDFLKSQRSCKNTGLSSKDSTVEDASDCDTSSSDTSSPIKITNGSEQEESSNPNNGFQNMLHQIKISVLDMMRSLSGFFQNLFGGSSERIFPNFDGTGAISDERIMEASFMGLAVMSILVILLKRGG